MLGIATGCFYKLDMSLEEEICAIKNLDVEGIEITFSSTEELMNTTKEDLDGLEAHFKHISLHSPIEPASKTPNDAEKVLQKLEKLRKTCNASHVVFHPPQVSSLEKIMQKTEPAIENMQARKQFDRDKFNQFVTMTTPVVIDVCHAATWSEDESEKLISKYKDQISHIHFSALGEKSHQLTKDNPKFVERLPKEIEKYPIIIENKLSSKEDLEKEVEFVRRNLNI